MATEAKPIPTAAAIRRERALRKRALRTISTNTQEDLIALGILQGQLLRYQEAVDYRTQRIIKAFAGVELGDDFLADLVKQHNRRAAARV